MSIIYNRRFDLNIDFYRENDSDSCRCPMHIERLEHLEERPRRFCRRIAEDDDVEEVLADAAQHPGECRTQQLIMKNIHYSQFDCTNHYNFNYEDLINLLKLTYF